MLNNVSSILGKVCPVDADPSLALSPWTVETYHGTNCTVEITSVGPTEEGEWHCQLSSNSHKAQRYFKLQVLKPAKVVLNGPAEIVVATDQVRISKKCQKAPTQPFERVLTTRSGN